SDYDAGLMAAERIVRGLANDYKRKGLRPVANALYDAADHVGAAVFTHPQQCSQEAQPVVPEYVYPAKSECCQHERYLGIAIQTVDSFEGIVAAARAVVREAVITETDG